MNPKWEDFFLNVNDIHWSDPATPLPRFKVDNILALKKYLDIVHIKSCLLKPYIETKDYPLVDPRDLLPSFETDLYEFEYLPGFSLVAFSRAIDYFNEIFQFDIIHTPYEKNIIDHKDACPLPETIHYNNLNSFLNKLPKNLHEQFKSDFSQKDIADLKNYGLLFKYILQMDRGHVMALDANNDFYLAGIYASFPSDLDTELKRFGLRIKKFKANDNVTYELNRNFVYQFLMELYGFPIVSERRTSAALFARRLFKLGETFLIRVLGQSDRTITTLYADPKNKFYPRVEKIALVKVETTKKDTLTFLKEKGYFVDPENQVVLIRVIYRQHKYDPNNVREDRALSVLRQELINPYTTEICTSVNIIKDTYSMTLKLNDIVKGEFIGRIKYKREIVENTETHEKRLKFLYAWLNKHQRRIIGYSDEFYANVVKVLDNYLLNSDLFDKFNEHHSLYQEVWEKYSYIQQARKVKILEDLKKRRYNNQRINYLQMLEMVNNILNELKFEVVNYFDELIFRTIFIAENILNDSYLLKRYVKKKDEELSKYGQKIKKLYGRLVTLVDELKSIRKTKQT
ncbi:hypothetical protein KFV02_05650 [Desulfohalobiaceae bacterium Ax17]|uniref:hypothetical protein n=1 Tax=Desulfovulcanus ferrireducens TaxID=2831190 RepID=UPI00207BCE1E|nr:hypothetical protein [Desulfovulcanus ferrireducens]MBT8763412.1 hypothetical protein [Desulfovulcanus ferrireducens]